MEYKDILADLKKKNYSPVYFLSGEEPYFIDVISGFIEKNVLDETEREFNQVVLYGRDTDIHTVITEAKGFPMMGERKVVIVKEAQELKGLAEKKVKEEDDDDDAEKKVHPLVAYCEKPQPSTLLVFCYKYKTLDKRRALAKTIAKKAVYFESARIKDYKVPDWIGAYMKEKKLSAGPKTVQLLAEYLGNDLGKIVGEIDKLLLNLQPGTEITPEHIETYIGISKDYNIFELQDAFASRNIVKANRIALYYAANPKEHPMPVTIASLYNWFTKILLYHDLPDKSGAAAARVLGINPFFIKDYAAASKTFSVQKLRSVFSFLRECDMRWKGVDNDSAGDESLLKELVWKIVH